MEKLKYLSFVLLMVFCVGFTSCDDEDEGISRDAIVGIWKTQIINPAWKFVLVLEDSGRLTEYTFTSDSATAEVSSWFLSGNSLCLYGDEYYEIKNLTGDIMVLSRTGVERTYTRISSEQLSGLKVQYDGIKYIYR